MWSTLLNTQTGDLTRMVPGWCVNSLLTHHIVDSRFAIRGKEVQPGPKPKVVRILLKGVRFTVELCFVSNLLVL